MSFLLSTTPGDGVRDAFAGWFGIRRSFHPELRNGMSTPFKKAPGGELLDWQKESCTPAIAAPMESFGETISAVAGLGFYGIA